MDEFRDIGVPLTMNKWLILQGTLLHAKRTLGMLVDTEFPPQSISSFCSLIKKGSKKFRHISEKIAAGKYDRKNLRCVNTVARLTDTVLPIGRHLAACLGVWQRAYMNNDMRNFIFMLRNNDLKLNNRLNAFDDNVDPRCTFCRILNGNTNSRDGLKHAFYTCPVTNNLLRNLVAGCEPVPDINSREFRQLYWYGSIITDEDDEEAGQSSNLAGLIIFDLFRFIIWKFRQRRRVPNIVSFTRKFNFTLKICQYNSRRVSEILASDNMFTNFLQARG